MPSRPTQPSDRPEWNALTWLIGLVSITGHLEGGRPHSLLIVGPPSSGKSELMLRYRPAPGEVRNSHMLFATSVTSWGLSEILLNRVPQGVTHLVAPELQTLIKRKGPVWDATVGLLLPAMEEGVTDTFQGPLRKRFHGARIGFMTAIPDEAYDVHYRELESCGLLSRMLVVRFQRTNDNVLLARKAANFGDRSELQKISVPEFPKHGKIRVALSPRLATLIDEYAASLSTKEVHRASNRFQAFTKAVAWLNNEPEATEAHFRAITAHEKFWRF